MSRSVGQTGRPNLMQKMRKVLIPDLRFFLVPFAKLFIWAFVASWTSSLNSSLET